MLVELAYIIINHLSQDFISEHNRKPRKNFCSK